MRRIHLIVAALALALVLGCATPPAPVPEAPAATPPVTVIAISDYHGALSPHQEYTPAGELVEVGGAGLLATYVDRIRSAAEGPVLLLDAGDMFQGTLASNLAEGAPVIDLYNHLGIQGAALGNHEFDFGPAGPKSVAMEEGDDPRGALKARIAQAEFPILSVNVRNDDGTHNRLVPSSRVIDVDGVSVAIIGASTVMTPTTTAKAHLVGLSFPEPTPYVEELARAHREQGVDFVVVVYHDGATCDDHTVLGACTEGPVFELARALTPGLVDVIVGGHTHQVATSRVNGIVVLQSGARSRFLTYAEVPRGDARPTVHPPVPVCGHTVPTPDGPSCDRYEVRKSKGPVSVAEFLGSPVAPDAEAAAVVSPALEAVRAAKERSLGVKTTAIFGRSYDGESALGNLVADALAEAVEDAPIGMSNGGGLRADLPEGPLTYGHVFEALPFDNALAVLTVDGETLSRIVKLGHNGGHGALSWSGLSFRAKGCEVTDIQVGAGPLDPAATYRIVTNDYLAGGGSGFETLGLGPEAVEVRWDLGIMRDVVARVLPELGALDPSRFYDPEGPRNALEGRCEAGPNAGN